MYNKIIRMELSNCKVGLIGNGSWATAIAKMLSKNLDSFNWWVKDDHVKEYIEKNHHNPKYLTDAEFNPEKLNISTDINEVVTNSDIIFLVVPSIYVEKYKTIVFKSTHFKKIEKNKYYIYGMLTIRGVTKPVIFETILKPDDQNSEKLDVLATTIIKRSDFGMQPAVAGIGENVNIQVKGVWVSNE